MRGHFFGSATALFYVKLLFVFLLLKDIKKNQSTIGVRENFHLLTSSYSLNAFVISLPIFRHFYCEQFYNIFFFNNGGCATNAPILPVSALFFFKYNKFFFFKYLGLSLFGDKSSSEINYNTFDASRMYYKLNKFAKRNNTDYPLDISGFARLWSRLTKNHNNYIKSFFNNENLNLFF